jgi:hypothetical protein
LIVVRSASQNSAVGVFYLARGADENALEKFQAFQTSYRRWSAGVEHQLCVIFKGFANRAELIPAQDVFRGLAHRSIYVDDAGYDLGAYLAAAARVDHENVCFLNTASEILGSDWLLKLAINFAQPGVGMVGCTASYEAPQHPGRQNVPFPNPHLRSNAFMIRRDQFLAMRPDAPLTDKIDVHLFEHGKNGITRRMASQGRRTILVGRNGRGYEPAWWVGSQTFRQGTQANLLVADNQTKTYEKAPLVEKRVLFQMCWGDTVPGEVDSVLLGRSGQLESSRAGGSVDAEMREHENLGFKSVAY